MNLNDVPDCHSPKVGNKKISVLSFCQLLRLDLKWFLAMLSCSCNLNCLQITLKKKKKFIQWMWLLDSQILEQILEKEFSFPWSSLSSCHFLALTHKLYAVQKATASQTMVLWFFCIRGGQSVPAAMKCLPFQSLSPNSLRGCNLDQMQPLLWKLAPQILGHGWLLKNFSSVSTFTKVSLAPSDSCNSTWMKMGLS